MVRFHRYGLFFVFLACCGPGLALGMLMGVGGAVAGAVTGGVAGIAAMVMLDTQEKMENAVFGGLSVVFAIALAWLGLEFWDLR
jgi:hypothetical protein